MESSLNKKQKTCLAQFVEFTCSRNKSQAVEILKDCNWNVDQAVEVFYTNYGGVEQVEEPVVIPSKSKSSDLSTIDSEFARSDRLK